MTTATERDTVQNGSFFPAGTN